MAERPRDALPPVAQRLRARLRSFGALQWALALSVAAHAALLLMNVAAPQFSERVFRDTPLEVILVNARSQEAPTKAQAVAQVQLAGGGEAAQGRATSPLPATATARLGNAAEDATQKIEQMQQEQQQFAELEQVGADRGVQSVGAALDAGRDRQYCPDRARGQHHRLRLAQAGELLGDHQQVGGGEDRDRGVAGPVRGQVGSGDRRRDREGGESRKTADRGGDCRGQ